MSHSVTVFECSITNDNKGQVRCEEKIQWEIRLLVCHKVGKSMCSYTVCLIWCTLLMKKILHMKFADMHGGKYVNDCKVVYGFALWCMSDKLLMTTKLCMCLHCDVWMISC